MFKFIRCSKVPKNLTKKKPEKNKILEKSNFDEVFDSNDLDASNYSDYNSIKDAVHSKLRN